MYSQLTTLSTKVLDLVLLDTVQLRSVRSNTQADYSRLNLNRKRSTMNITISPRAETKFNNLTQDTRDEVAALVDDLILTMPLEPADSTVCQDSEPKERHSSPGGSPRATAKSSSLSPGAAISALLLCWTLLLQATSSAAEDLASNKFLNAVMLVESGGRNVTGDNGKARGPFQFWAATWSHVTSLRRQANLPVYSYTEGASNTLLARRYAQTYFRWIEKNLRRQGCKHPTHADLYAAYNLGLTGYRRRGFDLNRCPAITRRAVAKIQAHLK